MDPATGALTLLGAAISLAKGIERIRGARKYPQECSGIFAETADLKCTLERCYALADSAKDSKDHAKSFDHLRQHATAAIARLQELESSLAKHSSQTGLASAKELRAFWTALVHGKERVTRCRDELRRIGDALSNSIALFTAGTLVPLDGKFEEFSATQKAIASKQDEILQYVLALATESRPSGPQRPPSYSSAVKDDMTRNRPAAPREPKQDSTAITRIPLPPDRLGKYCVPWCSCRCHTASSLNSSRAIKNIVGSFTISHSGLPYFTKECNEKRCRRKVSSKVNVSYHFPPAILQRKLELSYSFSALAGPEIRVRLPRVVDWTSPVWQHATVGNVMAVESLFRNGLASPWDVSPLGGNLLHYATDHWNADLCGLLLEAGLDPSVEDEFKSSGACIAWERVLSGKMSPNDASVVASLFKDTDYLSTRSFTVVHKIVLGLVSKDLDAELLASTADIDTKDIRGRTPLSWATARGDESAMRTLLQHGANPNLPDICGHFALHYVPNTACAEILLDHKANLDVLNGEGQTPLYTACRNISSASLTDYLLKKCPSDVNRADFSHQTPLHAAISNGIHLQFIDILLDAGADINARNSSGDSPLRFAITWNMHELQLRMLTGSNEAKFDGINSFGQSFAHAIAHTADVQTVKILTEAKPATLKADVQLQDASGKTSLDYFEERLAFLEEGEQAELREAFTELIQVLEASSKQYDDVKFSSRGKVKELVGCDVPITTKFDILVKITELTEDGNEMPGDVFHDAVESF